MKIGGFTKQSFIDWEGKITAVAFTKGCNYRCWYCHNPSLVIPSLIKKSPDIPIEFIIDFLLSRREWLEGVVITGGEPTIHNDLESILTEIRNIGYQIKLDTNGSNPAILEKLIKKKLVDFVAMDIKTVLKPEKYTEITGVNNPDQIKNIKQSVNILRNSNIKYQLRTTICPGHHTTEIIAELKEKYGNDNLIFQDYREGENLNKYC
ncbi:MAG: anaerobic ribonucleoside-triphosphate reductase activating protein [Prolixibacteraceae bacterium]|nr:anaerobic ribonucleoside-triphosphate reductase activating protein [Prolixibacteraceae bacterium]